MAPVGSVTSSSPEKMKMPAEQARIVQSLVERVDMRRDGADIRLRTEGLTSLIADVGAGELVKRRAA